ncbi:prolyl oligopeptidase family protein [Motilibacter rhizosphaerae]|uniref:Prolyl oligopeptidase family protein n=1 Tax=Motilibacter rhizosphaerae TaxID=598652 RepID=A0A4Q7NFV3_9ACTN|nr:alpha/beta fold hydrolase [Motilibacter rhizosphaerae]RZS82669.1 prolyl oligopeptidase family protein [Motilibacter rhizosphaerae]
MPRVLRYGDDPVQYAELSLPTGPSTRLPVVVVLHGGFWKAAYGSELGAPLAEDLVRHGVAAWNVEYRRVGAGGGWPETLLDVAAAVDLLATEGQAAAEGRLDLSKVVAVGHSAGGQLAAWTAARGRLPAGAPGSQPLVPLAGAVSQGGVLDLARAYELGLGGGAVDRLLGGSPADVPERYAAASPVALAPLGVPVAAVHGRDDDVVPAELSERYVAAAGDEARVVLLPGVGHFELIDPAHAAWAACREEVLRLTG